MEERTKTLLGETMTPFERYVAVSMLVRQSIDQIAGLRERRQSIRL